MKDKVLLANFRRYFKDQLWQNLYSKKGVSKELKKNNKTYIRNNGEKEYTEIEIMELSLCSFIIKFPNLLKIARIKEFVSDLTLLCPDLNEFKEWYISQIDKYDDINEHKTKGLAEKTGFYSIFLVLSDPKKIFLDSIFIEKNKANCELIFDFLTKKYYLLSLKQEYINIINSNKEEVRLKAFSYLKEIQKTHDQLSKLSEFFIN
jgi:hypothetical protein